MVTLDGENPKLKALTLLVAAKADAPQSSIMATAKSRANARLRHGWFILSGKLHIVFITGLMVISPQKFHRIWQPYGSLNVSDAIRAWAA
jgi:hypothetical protein